MALLLPSGGSCQLAHPLESSQWRGGGAALSSSVALPSTSTPAATCQKRRSHVAPIAALRQQTDGRIPGFHSRHSGIAGDTWTPSAGRGRTDALEGGQRLSQHNQHSQHFCLTAPQQCLWLSPGVLPSVAGTAGRSLVLAQSSSPKSSSSSDAQPKDTEDGGLDSATSAPAPSTSSPSFAETNVGPTADSSPLVKLAWYASEAFGKTVALFKGKQEEGGDASDANEALPLSREQAVELLRKDYSKSYFVTGEMTMGLYEPNCEFADPFVSFRGRDRFKQNVSNLGSFMEDVSLKIMDWDETEDKVTTKWRFSCVLGLPWRPILAASGGTDHFFDNATGRIVKHVERWDISPADGLRQLLKPNPKFKKRSS